MTGLFLVALLALAVLGLLRLAGLKGSGWTMAAAALMFGAAGYALTGAPGFPGSPRKATDRPAPPSLTGARHAMMGQFDRADRWMTIAEGFASRGDTETAARVMQTAVRQRPGDYAVWVGYGNALTDHARMINPAARLAYEQAARLAPGHPAPLFFYGLALARSGQPAEARRIWLDVLATAPPNASWRPIVEQGVMMTTALSGAGEPPR